MKHIQKIFSIALLFVFCFSHTNILVCAEKLQPEKKTFYVTAYYSPLPGQSFYLRGDIEAEKKLNGAGIHGASGKDVYPGMIAAPKTYEFGTKIKLEGMGVGTVHDRGGAIVKAGERGQSYDRLDIWVGYGEEGLKRALSWGKRKVIGYVYPLGSAIANSIDIASFKILNKKWPSNAGGDSSLFPRSLGKGSTGEDVDTLQNMLQELGYLDQDTGNIYDTVTIDAMYQFQKDHNIIKNSTDKGAGYFGAKTQITFVQEWYKYKAEEKKKTIALQTEKEKFLANFPNNVGKGHANKENVNKIQEGLIDIGYSVSVTGIYDIQTIEAVIQFQKENNIIQNENEHGAGYFGTKTKNVFADKVFFQQQQKEKSVVLSSSQVEKKQESKQEISNSSSDTPLLTTDLKKNNSGPEVIKLQKTLIFLGLLTENPTGYYGPKTEDAVLAFQIRYKLAGSKTDIGAGIFGHFTRKTMNSILSQYEEQKIKKELDKGEKGEEVKKVQDMLKKLGYFKLPSTGYYGAQTEESILAFQLDQKIIESKDSLGAGRVGQATMEKLNQEILKWL